MYGVLIPAQKIESIRLISLLLHLAVMLVASPPRLASTHPSTRVSPTLSDCYIRPLDSLPPSSVFIFFALKSSRSTRSIHRVPTDHSIGQLKVLPSCACIGGVGCVIDLEQLRKSRRPRAVDRRRSISIALPSSSTNIQRELSSRFSPRFSDQP